MKTIRPFWLVIILALCVRLAPAQTHEAGMLDIAGTWTARQNFKNLNDIRFADQYATGSQTGGIAEAYAAGPSHGVYVICGADITISSPQTIAMGQGKPLFLDMAGHSITETGTTTSLTFTGNGDGSGAYVFNGTLYGPGRGTTSTALRLHSYCRLKNLTIRDFGTGVDVDGAIYPYVEYVQIYGCAQPLKVHGTVYVATFRHCKFTGATATDAVTIQDARNVLFEESTFEVNNSVNTVHFLASDPANPDHARISGITFRKCWFEANLGGRVSNEGAEFLFTPANNDYFLTLEFDHNQFYHSGHGSVYKLSPTGNGYISAVKRDNNYYGVMGGTNYDAKDSGFTAAYNVTDSGQYEGISYNSSHYYNAFPMDHAQWVLGRDNAIDFINSAGNGYWPAMSVADGNTDTLLIGSTSAPSVTIRKNAGYHASDSGTIPFYIGYNNNSEDSGYAKGYAFQLSKGVGAGNPTGDAILALKAYTGFAGGYHIPSSDYTNALTIRPVGSAGLTNPGLEINGGLVLNTTVTRPSCSSTTRGTFWVKQGGNNVKDNVQVCAKDGANAYAWRTIY